MKTLGEFIQRLQDDAAFEKKAQTFVTGDELMAFVKDEGYDFTLEELTNEFKHGVELSKEADGMAPAPTDAGAATGLMPEDAAFPRNPEAFLNGEKSTALTGSESHNFSREQPGEGLQKPKGEMPPQGPEQKLPGGLLRGGGGRHRGFSPQRIKSIPGEEP